MLNIGLPKSELLAVLRQAELTPELIAEAIELNNKRILKQLEGPEFARLIDQLQAKNSGTFRRPRGL
ncbi:MAG: hypothetical protein FH749_07900 [Firmicutes bacterium]|nr:hypothetical protein [Bacillota bacterium]